MSENKNICFIREIIQQTKEKKLVWEYLDSNQALYEGMGWINKKVEYNLFSPNKEIKIPDFNIEDSFFTRINNMYIVIYVRQDEPAKLYVVPNTYKKVVILTPDEYGELIIQLLNLVQNQFPDAASFIDEFLNNIK